MGQKEAKNASVGRTRGATADVERIQGVAFLGA
jgi:hypothetical protein